MMMVASEGEAMTGCGNYNLPIKSSDGTKNVFNLWYNFIAHLKVSFLMKNNVVGFKAHPTDYYQFNKDTYIQ